jgi:hypothetical protein
MEEQQELRTIVRILQLSYCPNVHVADDAFSKSARNKPRLEPRPMSATRLNQGPG